MGSLISRREIAALVSGMIAVGAVFTLWLR